MAEYDGEVRIKTLIENGEASSRLMQMEAKFQKLTSEAKRLTDGMREIEQRKVPTEEYAKLEEKLKAAKYLLEQYNDALKSMPSENKEQRWQELTESEAEAYNEILKIKEVLKKPIYLRPEGMYQQLDEAQKRLKIFESMEESVLSRKESPEASQYKQEAEKIANSIKKIKNEMQTLNDAGKAFSVNQDPESMVAYDEKAEKLRDINTQLDILNKKMNEVADKEAKAGRAGTQSLSKTQEAVKTLKTEVSKVAPLAGKAGNSSKQIEKVGKAAKKTAGLMSTLLSRLKGITLSLFIFNWITKGFNAMVAAFKEGIQNMAKYSGDFNSKMSEMKSATATLKASLGTLAAPIVSAIVPAIVTLCNWLTTAINKINMLISALSGKSTWTRAKKQQVDYAKSLNSTAAAAKKAVGALQGFDELNVINSNSDSGSGASGGTSGGGYEEVPISEKDFAWIDKVKAGFEKILSAIQPVTDALKNLWENGLKKLGDFSYDALLGFYEHFLVPVGKWVLGEGLPRFINALNDGLMKIDFDKIIDALNKLWDALAPFAINVGEGLLWFWENVLVPLGTWVANEVVPRFLETVANCIDILNTVIEEMKPTFQWFWDNVLQPIAEWVADKFLEAWDAINNALEKFGNWCSEHEEVIETITIILISLGAAIGIVNAAIAIATLVTTALGAAIGFLTSPITLVILAITALIAIGILLYKHWDEIKEKAIEIWENIKETISEKIEAAKEKIHEVIENIKAFWSEKWEGIKTKVTEIWEKIKETISEKISNIKEKIKGTLENIKETWTEKWSNMKSTVVGIFRGIWSGIKGIINSIIGGIEKMVNSVISGLNTMIGAMNKLSWDIPDWVPEIGGNKFGLNIPTVNTVSIPRLANGGITTGSTLANIGEAGREAVLPLENNLGYLEPLAEMIASKMEGVQTVRVVPDKSNIFKVVREEANGYYRRTGNPAFNF